MAVFNHIPSDRLPANHVAVTRNSPWGNPFALGRDGTAAEVLTKYRTWLWSRLHADCTFIEPLCGMHLASWASPECDHAVVLEAALRWLYEGSHSPAMPEPVRIPFGDEALAAAALRRAEPPLGAQPPLPAPILAGVDEEIDDCDLDDDAALEAALAAADIADVALDEYEAERAADLAARAATRRSTPRPHRRRA